MSRNKKGKSPARRPPVTPSPERPPRVKQGDFFPQAFRFQKTTYHSGPLPTPESLHEYNLVEPSAADRIIAMAEREGAHRHAMERGVLQIHGRNSTLGIVFGFIFGMSTVCGGLWAMMNGADVLGGVSALGGLATIIGIFIYQRRGN